MCASVLTDQSVSRRAEERLWGIVEKMGAADAAIMTAGFIAGIQGYTPLTAIIKLGISEETKSAFEDMAVAIYLITGGVFQWTTYLLGKKQSEKEKAGEEITATDKAMAVLGMGCIGLIEAYAVTRPGFLAGVGEVIKGIGEIIPG